ncbi:hypothetical protein AQUCO_00300068v1 [Aquilegia coerulea]|uniref:Uncharacterized protein n=1 Tax=Aquilegia coerulea TaxID=218851 RepID=A0A2G5EX09_AQUCA|nr:hypothetical protein AQUCO_00300068v1 [Aquilegia coerulea]
MEMTLKYNYAGEIRSQNHSGVALPFMFILATQLESKLPTRCGNNLEIQNASYHPYRNFSLYASDDNSDK